MHRGQITVRDHFTTAQFRRMVEAGVFEGDETIELIGGQLVVMPPQGPQHAAATRLLMELLLAQGFTLREVLHENPVLLGAESECVPDLVIVTANPEDPRFRRQHPTPTHILLVLEVSDSTLTYDRLVKTKTYASAGIAEYWLVDINGRRLLTHAAPRQGEYTQTTNWPAGNGAQVVLPGNRLLDVDALLTNL